MPVSRDDTAPVLDVDGLEVSYRVSGRRNLAVRGVTFHIARDEVFGLVGESGSGKSTLSQAILRLLPSSAEAAGRHVRLEGDDLLRLPEKTMRKLRWTKLAYIPQGSMGVFNPVTRLREQFLDVIWDHAAGPKERKSLEARIGPALAGVHLRSDVLDRYPHELSGGMKQRACIALAILLEPRLVIADEPTSALDVVSQRAVLETLSAARRRVGASMILIGHDMALQAQISDRIGILFAGRFVEIGPTRSIFSAPAHPYTQRLIAAIPSIRKRQDIAELARRGLDSADDATTAVRPLVEVAPGHLAAV